MARSVSLVRSSIELNWPCCAASVKSVVYLASNLERGGVRRGVVWAFALRWRIAPVSSENAINRAVSHRHPAFLLVLLCRVMSGVSNLFFGSKSGDTHIADSALYNRCTKPSAYAFHRFRNIFVKTSRLARSA